MKLIAGFFGGVIFILIIWIVLPLLHATIWRKGKEFSFSALPSFGIGRSRSWRWDWLSEPFWFITGIFPKWIFFYPLAGANFLWQKHILRRNVSW